MSVLGESFELHGLSQGLDRLEHGAASVRLRETVGRVTRVSGTIVEASLAGARLGELCAFREPGDDSGKDRYGEVVGFRDGIVLLSPLGEIFGLSPRTQVARMGVPLVAPVGDAVLGRVLDGLGRPIDARPLHVEEWAAVDRLPPDALSRAPIVDLMPMGIPAIDAMTTVGQGQRVGLFGEAGVGKSTLMSAIAKAASADVAVIALVGERGREVSEFVEDALGEDGLRKSVVIAATSDRPAMERIKAPFVATAIAEHFRDRGLKVVLLMDSLTRLARAQREVGLAAGEPPARRAFPPSVFALMPKLIERAGVASNGGSITAFYTVLVEDDGMGDPIGEEARSLLDGHIVLSRKIAEAGKFPAIDILASRSRVMTRVAPKDHVQAAERVRALMSRYKEIELLLRMGEYAKGSDAFADEAIAKKDRIDQFMYHPLDLQEEWQAITSALQHLSSAQS